MPGPKEKRAKLYQGLVADGILDKQIKEEFFEKGFQDDKTRHKTWKTLNDRGDYTKSFEEFTEQYAGDIVKKKEPTLQKQETGLPSSSTTSPTGLPQTSTTPTAENKYVTDSMIDLNEVAKNPLFANDPNSPELQEKIKNGTVGMGDINWANYRASVGQTDDAPFKYPKEMDAKISELDKKKAKELEVLDKRLAAKTLTAQEHSALKKERMGFYDAAIGDLNGKKKEFIAQNFDDSDAAAFGIHQEKMKQEVKLLVNEVPEKTDALAARNDIAFQKLQQKSEAAKSFEDDPNYMMLDPNKTISQNKEDIESAQLKKREDKAGRIEQIEESGAMAKWDKSQWESYNKQKASLDEYSYAQIEETLDEMELKGTERAETRTYLMQKAKTEPMLRDAEIKARELANQMGVKTPEQTIQAYKERTAKVNEAYSMEVAKRVEDLKSTAAIIDDNHKKEVDAYHAAAEKELVEYKAELYKQVEAGTQTQETAQQLFDQRKAMMKDGGNQLYKAFVGRRTKYQSDVTKEIERLGMMKTGMLGEVAKLKAEYGIKEDEEGKLGFTEDYMNEYNAIWQSVVSQAEYADRVKKDLAWDKMGFEQKLSQSVSSGMLNLAETMGVGVKWFAPGLDFPDIAIDFIEDYREGAAREDMSQYSVWEKLTNFDYMVTSAAEQLPLMLPMVGASALGYSAASGALKGFGLSTKARAALAATVGGVGSRLVEANMEGYSVFQEKLKSGADWQEAYDAGSNVRMKNMALSVFDSFQTYIAFGKQPKLLMTSKGYQKPTALQGALTMGKDLGLTFASGASEELIQEYWAEAEFNPMLNFIDFATSDQGIEIGVLGGLMEGTFALNGILRGRDGLATVNDQFTKFFNGMDADQVSADDMANRSLDLIQTLEHLKSREVITKEEYDQGLNAINSTVEDFKAAANGELPFQWKDDRLKQYTAFRSEAENLRKQAEDMPRSKALEKEALEKRADLLDKEVDNLYKNVEANTYSIDGVPVTKSEFESILNDPENLAQLEGHKLETDDMAVHAKLISEKGVLSERIKAIEEAKTYVASVSEGLGLDYAMQLHEQAMAEQKEVLTNMKNVGNGSKYRAEVQKARKMGAMMEGLKALKAQEKETVAEAVSTKSAELTAAASTFLDKEGKTEPTKRDISQTSAKLEKENAKLAEVIFATEEAILKDVKDNPNYRNTPEYLQEKSNIADWKIKIRENNKLLDGMKILSKDTSIPETKNEEPVQEATNELVETGVVEEVATDKVEEKQLPSSKIKVSDSVRSQVGTGGFPEVATATEEEIQGIIAKNEEVASKTTNTKVKAAIEKQTAALKELLPVLPQIQEKAKKLGMTSISNEDFTKLVDEEIEDTTEKDAGVEDSVETKEPNTPPNDPVADRERGYRVVKGKKIERPAPIKNKVVGAKKNVTFGRDARTGKPIKVEAEYTVIELEDLQPSHKNGIENQKFFIPEAQPRNRSQDIYVEQDALKGANLDPERMGQSAEAFFGAPVTNERGEVIQGNGRAAALHWYHKRGKKGGEYKKWLMEEAKSLGIDPKDIEGMTNPVLVRMTKQEDAAAIKLGNMSAKELEDVSREGEREVASLRTVSPQQKAYLASVILSNSENEDTVKDVMREAGMKALKYMVDIGMLRPEERAQMVSKRGNINANGVEFLEKTIKALFFQGTSNEDYTAMDDVHGNIRAGVERALVGLLSMKDEKALNKEIANILAVLGDFYAFKKKYKETNFESWMNQVDLEGNTPRDRLSENEQAIALFMTMGGDQGKVPNQKEITAKLMEYIKATSAQEETLFEKASEGMGKEEAVKKVFPKKGRPGKDFQGQYRTRRVEQTKADVVNAQQMVGTAESTANSPSAQEFPVKLSPIPRSEIDAYKAKNRGLVPFRRDIITNLRKSLSFFFKGLKFVPRIVYAKHRNNNVLGVIMGNNMQIKISNYADIDTIVHELGHWLDMGNGITKAAKGKLDQELAQFWDFSSAPPGSSDKAKKAMDYKEQNYPNTSVQEAIEKMQVEIADNQKNAADLKDKLEKLKSEPALIDNKKQVQDIQKALLKKQEELETVKKKLRLVVKLNLAEINAKKEEARELREKLKEVKNDKDVVKVREDIAEIKQQLEEVNQKIDELSKESSEIKELGALNAKDAEILKEEVAANYLKEKIKKLQKGSVIGQNKVEIAAAKKALDKSNEKRAELVAAREVLKDSVEKSLKSLESATEKEISNLKDKLDEVRNDTKAVEKQLEQAEVEKQLTESNKKTTELQMMKNGLGEMVFIAAKAKESLKQKGNTRPTEKQIADEIEELQQDYRRMEGFAEFVRAWTLNPDAAMAMAPKTYNAMYNAVIAQKDGVKRWKELETASYEVRFWESLNDMERAQATSQETQIQFDQRPFIQKQRMKLEDFLAKFGMNSVNGEPNLTTFDKMSVIFSNDKQPMKVAMERLFKMHGLDYTQTMKDSPDKNFYFMTRLMAGMNDKARLFLEKTGIPKITVDANGSVGYEKVLDNGQAMTIDWLMQPLSTGPNFKEASVNDRTVQIDSDKQLALNVMRAQRTLELKDRFDAQAAEEAAAAGKEVVAKDKNISGLGGGKVPDYVAAQNILDEFAQMPQDVQDRINEFARRYRVMADATMQYARDSGLVSSEKYEEIKAANMYYVSFNRIFEDDFENISNPSGYGQGQQKAVQGSARDMADGVESMIGNFFATIARADKNFVNSSLIDLIRGDEFGLDPMPLERFGVKVDVPGNGVMTYYNKGKVEYWKLDPDLAQAFGVLQELSSHTPGATNAVKKGIMNLIGLRAKVLQFSITRWPGFALLTNPIRDFQFRKIASRTARMPFLNSSDNILSKLGLKDSDFDLTNAEAREKFFMYGGGQSGYDHYLKSQEHYHKALHFAINKLATDGKTVMPSPAAMWGKYNDILAEGELVNRIAEFKQAYKFFRKQGLSEYAAYKRAAFEARDLCDFAIQGSSMQYLRHAAPFLNANVQGLKRYLKYFKEMSVDGWQQKDPTLFARLAIFSALPSIAMVAMAHAFGYEDEYGEIENADRDMFYKFKLWPGMDGFVSVAKPFELGVLGSYFERMVDATVYNKGMAAFDGHLGTLARGMVPMKPWEPYQYMGSLKTVLELNANYDSYRKEDILFDGDKKNVKERDGTKYASDLGKWLSNGVGEWIGIGKIDPRNVDYFISDWFGYLGNHSMKIANAIGGRMSYDERDELKKEMEKLPETSARYKEIEEILKTETPAKSSQLYSPTIEGFFQELKLYKRIDPASLKVIKSVMTDIKDLGLRSTSDAIEMNTLLESARDSELGVKAIKDIVKYAKTVQEKYTTSKELYDQWLDGNLKKYKDYDMEGLSQAQAKSILFE